MEKTKTDTFYVESAALKKVIEELHLLGDTEAACRVLATAAIFLDLPLSIQQGAK